MKEKIRIAMLVWLIMFSNCILTVHAGEIDVAVISGLCEIADAMTYELPIIQVGDNPALLELPTEVECIIEGREIWDTYFCPVEWEDLSEIDTSLPGRITVTGNLIPEEGYQLSEEVSPCITYSAFVAGAAQELEALTAIESKGGKNLLAVGGDVSKLRLSKKKAVCFTENYGEYFTCPVEWNLHELDVNTPGTYEVTGEMMLPAGFALPQGFEKVVTTIGIVAEEKIDLSAVMTSNQEQIICQWLMPIEPLSVILEYAIEDEEWKEDPAWENGAGYFGYAWEKMLVIHTVELEEGKDYHFRLKMDEDYTHALYIRKEADGIITKGGIERMITVSDETKQENTAITPVLDRDEKEEEVQITGICEEENPLLVSENKKEEAASAIMSENKKKETVSIRKSEREKEKIPTAVTINNKKETTPVILTDLGEEKEIEEGSAWIPVILILGIMIMSLLLKILMKYLLLNFSWTIMKYKKRSIFPSMAER